MIIFEKESFSLKESEIIIKKDILPQLNFKDKVFLIGDLGAGKTFFTQKILEFYGLSGIINSPTFTLINKYQKDENQFLHIDLYRLNSKKDLQELFLEEEFLKEQMVFIEWANKFPYLYNYATKKISLTVTSLDSRRITFEKF